MPRETIFSQSAICQEMARVEPGYRFGVCSVLAVQWMFHSHANGMKLEDMWFYRVGVGHALLKTFVDVGMKAGRAAMIKACRFHTCPPKRFGAFEINKALAAIIADSENDAYFYLKLEWGAEGHAIGVRLTSGGCGFFDPNEKEVLEIPTESALRGELGALILEKYFSPPPTGFEVQRLLPMGPKWVSAQPSGARRAGAPTIGRY